MVTEADFISLLPLLVLPGAAIIIMLLISFWRNHQLTYIISSLSLIAAFGFVMGSDKASHLIEPLLIIDGFGLFNMGLIVLTALAVSMLSYAYFEQREERKGEYYILLMLATFGACVLVISNHFASLFLGLEILSVALYGKIAYLRKREKSDEAGLKYLILAAFSSAFILFGMALVYMETGFLEFVKIGNQISSTEEISSLLIAGFGLMVVGVGFKLGVVPFHMWAPDVYEGAPAPVTAFIATVSKGGMVALLVRLFVAVNGYEMNSLTTAFTVIAIASMFIGNFLAIQQSNIKRLLAYSSIAHLGYLLVAFLAGGTLGVEAVSFYLVAYFITSLGAFGTVTILSDEDRDSDQLDDYQGLFWRRPLMATVFTGMLLSLAGIPLTVGFVGKFYLIAAGVKGNQWLLVVMLAINSVIGLYYYIRIIAKMIETPTEEATKKLLHPTSYMASMIVIAALMGLLVWLGVNPNGMMMLIRELVVIG
jgi:NADH-quinone oxidoreductase subunit N